MCSQLQSTQIASCEEDRDYLGGSYDLDPKVAECQLLAVCPGWGYPLTTSATRPSSTYVRSAFGLAVKEAIWFLTLRHVQGSRRNICLFASYRGGSTWLMELIASEKGMRSLNEPMGPWTGSIAQTRHMRKYAAGQIIHFRTDSEESQLRRYVNLLLSGRAPVNAPWWFWRRGYPFRSNRMVLKIPEAKCIIDWFSSEFDVQIVLVTRHPVSRSLSYVRNGWESYAHVFLDNEWFRDDQLGAENTSFCRRILAEGSDLDKHVLGWTLEYLIPLRLISQRPDWVFVGYENCVAEADDTLRMLAERLDLSGTQRMQERLRTPSRSSRHSDAATRSQVAGGDTASVLGRWREHVSEDEERSLLEIPERLGIPLYRPGQDLPQPWW